MNKFIFISIIPSYSNNELSFLIIPFIIDLLSIIGYCNINEHDKNLVIISINIQNENDDFNKLTLNYFKWFEKNVDCQNNITEFSFYIYIPSFNIIEQCIVDKTKIKNFNKILNRNLRTFISQIENDSDVCIKYTCRLIINNTYLIGKQSLTTKTKTHEFSFGTHFIPINENEYIGLGHIKINSRNIKDGKILYDENSKPYKVQKKLYNFMNSLFGYNFKQHFGSVTDCTLGYSYFSYFILYNKDSNTFKISDFFLTADMTDKYHFTLLFTIGIMNINEFTYITSGEGDYYNSIIKFNTEDIIRWCKYDALSSEFNINSMTYSVIIKDIDSNIHNIVINDSLDIPKEVEKFTGIQLLQLGNPYKKLETPINYVKKYLKYKNKYIKLKNNFI